VALELERAAPEPKGKKKKEKDGGHDFPAPPVEGLGS